MSNKPLPPVQNPSSATAIKSFPEFDLSIFWHDDKQITTVLIRINEQFESSK